MARAKKETQEEVLEQNVEETKEETTKETKKTKATPVNDDPYAELKAKRAAKSLAIFKENENKIKLYCQSDTPYLTVPNLNNNIAGIIPKGTMLYAEKIVDSYPNGTFYKINDNQYVNKEWDFEVF